MMIYICMLYSFIFLLKFSCNFLEFFLPESTGAVRKRLIFSPILCWKYSIISTGVKFPLHSSVSQMLKSACSLFPRLFCPNRIPLSLQVAHTHTPSTHRGHQKISTGLLLLLLQNLSSRHLHFSIEYDKPAVGTGEASKAELGYHIWLALRGGDASERLLRRGERLQRR